MKFQEGFRKNDKRKFPGNASTAAGNFQDQPVAWMDCAVLQIVPLLDLIRRYIMLPGNGPERIAAAHLIIGIVHGLPCICCPEHQTIPGMDHVGRKIVPLLDLIRRYIILPGNGPERIAAAHLI